MPFHPGSLLRLGVNRIRATAGLDPLDKNAGAQDALKQAGQIVVIFALMLTVIIGLVGIAIDTTYAWRESLRVQRASDAASLAGVVYMPGCFDAASGPNCGTYNATAVAKTSAGQNGFPVATNTVTASKGATPRELDITITTSVPTFFSRIFGINSWAVSRSSKAVYVTPVPMGSPLAYYGTYQLCDAQTAVPGCTAQVVPTGVVVGSSGFSQGFFGAIEGEGSNTSTGDAFAPYYNANPTLNSAYNSAGYEYDIVANSTGTVYLYDPMFCATATKQDNSGHSGAGDHWLGTPVPVSTYYIMYDTQGTPLTTADDGPAVANSGNTYANQNQVDESAEYGGVAAAGNQYTYSDSGAGIPSGATDCQSNLAHNKWVSFSGVTAGHTYRLMITTTDQSNLAANRNQNFENMFSIAVSGANNEIHGNGSMESYANISSGSQEFYLAQIDRLAGAGKTVEIDLFDPGDTNSASWVQIEPDSSSAAIAWKPATFSYTSTNGRSNASTNCVQTHGGAGTPPAGCTETSGTNSSFYNNAWVSIFITLDTSYGLPDPPPSLINSGWWKIKYTVNSGNDTTTWQVAIRGNPVHLI